MTTTTAAPAHDVSTVIGTDAALRDAWATRSDIPRGPRYDVLTRVIDRLLDNRSQLTGGADGGSR